MGVHIIHWGRDYYQGRCHCRRALAAVVERHELPSVLRHVHQSNQPNQFTQFNQPYQSNQSNQSNLINKDCGVY